MIRPDSSQNQLTIINQTAFVGPADTTTVTAGGPSGACHESFLRDYQTNQSNTVLGDVSLLSKIGGAESKSHLKVAHYGTATGNGIQSHNGSILIN